MSDGTLNFPLRTVAPSAPAVGRAKIWVSDVDGKPYITDSSGNTFPFESQAGRNYASGVNKTLETNNTTTYEEYVSLNYSNVDLSSSATYEIDVNFVWNFSSGSNDFLARVMLNGTQFGEGFRREPKDTGSDQRYYQGFKLVVFGNELSLPNGSISIEFASSSPGDTARMYYCYLSFRRVA